MTEVEPNKGVRVTTTTTTVTRITGNILILIVIFSAGMFWSAYLLGDPTHDQFTRVGAMALATLSVFGQGLILRWILAYVREARRLSRTGTTAEEAKDHRGLRG